MALVFTTRTTVVFWIGWRTSEILENVLGEGYEGWLMSDGYNAYRRFLKRCRCWAHLLRKAQGLVECLDSEAQHFGRQTVDVLDTLMAAIRTARDDPPTPVYRGYMAIFWKTIGLNVSG